VTADDMKAIVCCYWRFVRHCPYVATESTLAQGLMGGDCPIDVIAVNKNLYVIETEVKVSISDMRQELKKNKYRHHWALAEPHEFPAAYNIAKYFYFAVPDEISLKARQVIHELYPGAGLLVVREPREGKFDTYQSIDVEVVINPKQLLGAKPITQAAANSLLLRVVNQMCGSMVDAANARRLARGVQMPMGVLQ